MSTGNNLRNGVLHTDNCPKNISNSPATNAIFCENFSNFFLDQRNNFWYWQSTLSAVLFLEGGLDGYFSRFNILLVLCSSDAFKMSTALEAPRATLDLKSVFRLLFKATRGRQCVSAFTFSIPCREKSGLSIVMYSSR